MIGIQKSDLKSNPEVVDLINSAAEVIHSIILHGDPHVAKEYVQTLNENEKLIL